MRFFWTILFFTSLITGCTKLRHLQSSYSLDVYYVPWKYNDEGQLSVEELTGITMERISFFCSKSQELVQEIESLLAIQSLKRVDYYNTIEPRMVIRLKTPRGAAQEVQINRRFFIMIDGIVYFPSRDIINWINNHIPPAEFPKGIRVGC